jgi:hypothetical protein
MSSKEQQGQTGMSSISSLRLLESFTVALKGKFIFPAKLFKRFWDRRRKDYQGFMAASMEIHMVY